MTAKRKDLQPKNMIGADVQDDGVGADMWDDSVRRHLLQGLARQSSDKTYSLRTQLVPMCMVDGVRTRSLQGRV
jgi:hypothetical protein